MNYLFMENQLTRFSRSRHLTVYTFSNTVNTTTWSNSAHFITCPLCKVCINISYKAAEREREKKTHRKTQQNNSLHTIWLLECRGAFCARRKVPNLPREIDGRPEFVLVFPSKATLKGLPRQPAVRVWDWSNLDDCLPKLSSLLVFAYSGPMNFDYFFLNFHFDDFRLKVNLINALKDHLKKKMKSSEITKKLQTTKHTATMRRK